ncbi:hypothetical protein JXA48_00790 [Candidatus Woesearchaeota archaeon]|nr:hypothetical protein [Candidatus Woesearchaeota archaeon]
MDHFSKRLFVISLLLLLFSLTLVSAVSAETHIVVNSKDWRSVYLLTIYGKYTDADVVFFKNLADAQLKTKMIGVDEKIIVFESTSDPVIKKYSSLLKVNGYVDYTSFTFDSYLDLQDYLLGEIKPDGYFMMDSNYGLDPIAATTFILANNYFPLFVNQDNVDELSKLSQKKPTYIVGRTPVRILDKLQGTKIQGFPYETLQASTKLSIDAVNSDWGIIMRADTVDVKLLVKGLPIFVYHADEYIDEVAQTVKESNVSKFEVVGAGTAEIAKAIELQSQKNLNFMLKYGRKITNYPGLENDILDIDSVSFDYPIESLEIVDVVHYPELGVLALTFENTGNTPVLFFSNVEFANEPLSDENTHSIGVGERKTIPFLLSSKGLSGDVVRVTTRYGSSLPLKFSISGDPGNLFFESDVKTSYLSQGQYQLDLISSGFDTEKGLLEVVFKNPYDESLKVFSELLIGDTDVASSKMVEIDPNGKRTLFIEVPYLRDSEILDKNFNLITYLGTDDTTSKMLNSLLIEKKKEVNPKIFVIIIVVIAALAILFLLFAMKKDGDGRQRSTVSVKQSVKSTSKTSSKKTSKTKSRKSHTK